MYNLTLSNTIAGGVIYCEYNNCLKKEFSVPYRANGGQLKSLHLKFQTFEAK